MELDWSALAKEAATAGVLPAGDYNVIVATAEATQSSNGKPMIKTKLRVADGPHKDKPVWNQFVVSAENAIALRIFFQHMAALGLDSSFFAKNPSMDVVAQNLVNRACVVELGVRTWQGADRNEVKAVKPPQAGGPMAPGVVTGPPTIGPSAAVGAAPTPVATPAAVPTPATPNPTAAGPSVPPPPQAF